MNRDLLSRVAAAILVAVATAMFFGWHDHLRLARMQQMTPQAYYEHPMQLANEPFISHVVAFSVLGIFFIVCVEVVAFAIRAASPGEGSRRDE